MTSCPSPTHEFAIRNDGWVKLDPDRLGVIGSALADLRVGRIDGLASGVAYRRLQDAFVLRGRVMFQEDVLDTPEASCSEGRDFEVLRCWVLSDGHHSCELDVM